MNESTLWILCGCPASGKSTWAKQQIAENKGIIVSRDEIRFKLLTDEDDYFDKEIEVFNNYINDIYNGLVHNENVYADATHLNWPSRRKMLERIKKCYFSSLFIRYIPVIFNTPLNVCLSRNANRTGRAKVPEEVIRNMYSQFSSPKDDPFNYFKIMEVNYNE